LRDTDGVRRALDDFRPDVVFHLGARTDLHGNGLADYDANTTGVTNVIEAVASLGGDVRTIYASSRLVFAIDHQPSHDYDYRPSTVYGESKIAGEKIVRETADLAGHWCIVRPTSIWGPWFGVPYRDFFDSVRSGRYVRVRGFDPQKSYGFVGNSVHELVRLAAAEREATNRKVFWLADYIPIQLGEWAELISQALDVKRPRSVPRPVLKAAALGGDVLQRFGVREPPITSFRLANLLSDMVYDTRETEQVVGPLPYSLADGVSRTVAWLKEHAR